MHFHTPKMPSPLFSRSPRPSQAGEEEVASPASQFTERFGALNNNIRSIFNGSSVYSQSPAFHQPKTPKTPFSGMFWRQQAPGPIVVHNNAEPRLSTDSRSPLRPPPTAGSYMRAIAPMQDLQSPEVTHGLYPPLRFTGVDSETDQLQDEAHGRRPRRKQRRRRRKHRHNKWVRRRRNKNVTAALFKSRAARTKLFGTLISGLFLITALGVYLALALTRNNLGHEIHVLFICTTVGLTIFFCHSLVRLFMLALQPQEATPKMPSMTEQEGFHPVHPIRVHVARDEDLAGEEHDIDTDDHDDDIDLEKKIVNVAPPPPAYGLWRSSVRADPNLLHWQRVESVRPESVQVPRNESVAGTVVEPFGEQTPDSPVEQQQQAPRPPSYASDDGVSYVVEAAPRSTVRQSHVSHTGVSDIHPAWRPGYAMSEVTEWPIPRRV